MTEEQERRLLNRVAEIEEFQAGMSRRLVFARGEAMASTHCLAGIVDLLSRHEIVERSSMEAVIVTAGAALEHQRMLSDKKTQAAVDHAKLLLKNLQINLRSREIGPAVMFASSHWAYCWFDISVAANRRAAIWKRSRIVRRRRVAASLRLGHLPRLGQLSRRLFLAKQRSRDCKFHYCCPHWDALLCRDKARAGPPSVRGTRCAGPCTGPLISSCICQTP